MRSSQSKHVLSRASPGFAGQQQPELPKICSHGLLGMLSHIPHEIFFSLKDLPCQSISLLCKIYVEQKLLRRNMGDACVEAEEYRQRQCHLVKRVQNH